MTRPRKTRVAVVYGGRSTERAISAESANGIVAALDPDEFDVLPVGVAGDGRWELTAARTPAAIEGRPAPAGDEGPRALAEVDLVFPVLPEAYGEDGTVQGLLEMAGIPYVGATVFAAAATRDVEFTRTLAAAEGVPLRPYAVLRPGQTLPEEERRRVGLPAVVRPARGSAGTEITDWAQLDAAVEAARARHPKVLVEAATVGRDVSCAVLAGERGGAPEASALAEAVEDEVRIPAGLPERITKQIQEYACQAFTALDCAGLARVDFVVTPELDAYLRGIDTMPALAPESTFPRMWAAGGLAYPDLVNRLVRSALRRGPGLH